MSLNEKLKNLRNQRGISQEQLADMLNVSRQAVSKWETGESSPDVENLIRVGEVFGVSMDYLLKSGMESNSTNSGSAGNSFTGSFGNNNSAFDDFVNNANVYFDDEDYNESRFTFNLRGAIYPLATLIYLVLGFHWGYWHPGWLIFVGAWFLDEIAGYIKTGKMGLDLYSLALAGFLLVGFVWGEWLYGALLFVLAWVIDSVFIPKKKKRKQYGPVYIPNSIQREIREAMKEAGDEIRSAMKEVKEDLREDFGNHDKK